MKTILTIILTFFNFYCSAQKDLITNTEHDFTVFNDVMRQFIFINAQKNDITITLPDPKTFKAESITLQRTDLSTHKIKAVCKYSKIGGKKEYELSEALHVNSIKCTKNGDSWAIQVMGE